MPEDYQVVFESPRYADCADRALVLTSLEIPHEFLNAGGSCALVVPAEHATRARAELKLYERENPPRDIAAHRPLRYQNAMPGVIGYVIAVLTFAWLSDSAAFGRDWFMAGRVDGALIRLGEWWRSITSLTLHADLEHLAGNVVFGVLFGVFAGRLLGSGVAWLAIVLTGALGNLLNVLLLDSSHRAIGASTAVFAALGIVAGFVWRAKLLSQERWPYRIGPIVGGLALLMYTGTGDENTDVGAHLMGFVAGFAGGVLLSGTRDRLEPARAQIAAGAGAVVAVCAAWLVALA